jgi:uncharacterized iron-regulated protein
MTASSVHWLLFAASLFPAGRAGAPGDRTIVSDGRVPVGGWVRPDCDEMRDDALQRLAGCGVVLLGESHAEAEHHRWQLHTIAALFGLRPKMVLGFEMFPRRVQPALDRWCKGELSEAAFLGDVDWPTVWGFPAALYMPLFDFARMHRIPMLALNVDPTTRRRVAAGGFESVPSGEREDVGSPSPASTAYRARLFEWFKHHPRAGNGAGAESESFARFVRAQLFWDRAMAEAIAAARRDGSGPLVIGVMGSGHVEFGDGVPHQLAALGTKDVATAMPWPTDTDYRVSDRPIADMLFGVSPCRDETV